MRTSGLTPPLYRKLLGTMMNLIVKVFDFPFENVGLCTQDVRFCLEDVELCLENVGFCIQNDELCLENVGFCRHGAMPPPRTARGLVSI